MFLVVAKTTDRTADYATGRMEARGMDFVRLDSDRFGDAELELELPDSSNSVLAIQGKRISIASIRAVWLRRLVKPEAPQIQAPEARQFAEQEIDFALRWLIDLLGDSCPVIDPEISFISTQNKFTQLAIASQLGLVGPATLVTNNPGAARDFAARHTNVALKSVAGYGSKIPGGFYAAYTALVTPEILERFDAIRFAPVCLQEYVPKAYELRITVVGENIFPCRIGSQETERTRIDWRRYDASTPHSVHQIHDGLKKSLLAMMKHFAVRFASFDFIVTPDNREMFLEMNPASQYLWIEQLTGMPITDAILDELLCLSQTRRYQTRI
jgi:glutathione synthase/RimK-type ligase-like ATP-grasp enzyme